MQKQSVLLVQKRWIYLKRKISINIDNLILNGFDYNKQYEISSSIKKELDNQIRKNEFFQKNNLKSIDVNNLDMGSIDISHDMNPEKIGVTVATSIVNGLIRKSTQKTT